MVEDGAIENQRQHNQLQDYRPQANSKHPYFVKSDKKIENKEMTKGAVV